MDTMGFIGTPSLQFPIEIWSVLPPPSAMEQLEFRKAQSRSATDSLKLTK
jgi:hypothetical protein